MAGTWRGSHEDHELCSTDRPLHRLEDQVGTLLRSLSYPMHILLLGSDGVWQVRHIFQRAFLDNGRRRTHYSFFQCDKDRLCNHLQDRYHSGNLRMVLHYIAHNHLHNRRGSYRNDSNTGRRH